MKLDLAATCLVFPGQGSQSVGMGRDLAAGNATARALFARADDVLGRELSRVLWEGPQADLDDTANTQPALFVHSLAAMALFNELYADGKVAFMAGHSLGELSALAAAGALSFDDGLKLVQRRGALMKEAGERSPGRMAAILGLDIPALEQICVEASRPAEVVTVANDNCPGQVVISGAIAAVDRAMEAARQAGARRSVALAVSIAAHSPLMSSIQGEWDAAVDAAPMGPMGVAVIGNVSVQVLREETGARSDLRAQMQSRVRWTETIQWLANAGVKTFVEVGSGSVLSGLIKRITRNATTLQLGGLGDIPQIT